MDLTKQKLDWKLNDFAEELVELMDTEIKTLGRHESAQVYDKYMNLICNTFTECNALSKIYPSNDIVSHNLEILLVTSMVLKMSKMSFAA